MRKNIVFVFLLLLITSSIFSVQNPWGNLKKIYFYDSIRDYKEVRNNLEKIEIIGLDRKDSYEITKKLIRFGDYYFLKGDLTLAKNFYHKVLYISPDYWNLYNKLEKIERKQGKYFFNFKNVFHQLILIFKDFNSSFIMLKSFMGTLFFTGILVFFIYSLILFIKYFKLGGYDFLIGENGNLSLVKLALLLVLLLWPVFLLSGWFIYPFLILGFLWTYFNGNEKRLAWLMLVGLFILTFVYSIGMYLENNFKSSDFETVMKVYTGELFERESWQGFDSELKTVLAFSYYERKQYDTALDILNSIDEKYRVSFKFNLLGNIYYKYGNIDECISNYRESLSIDDQNKASLNNFTMVLQKNNDTKIFDSYANRYPEINDLKDKTNDIKEVRPDRLFLWKRLINNSDGNLDLANTIKNIFVQISKLPFIYYLLLFLAYMIIIKRVFNNIGESKFCTKCSKIIKESSSHKSYKLCDECYQLFLIKDVIFLEAKNLKEEELRRKERVRYVFTLILSLLVPGLNLNFRERKTLFLILLFFSYFLFSFTLINYFLFIKVFLASPLVLSLTGLLAIVFYFITNLISVLGDENGF